MPSRLSFTKALAAISALAVPASTLNNTTPYTLKTDLSGPNFFTHFTLFSSPDPTHGFVQYQPLSAAAPSSLIGHLDNHVFLGVDYTSPTPHGRPSVRAESSLSFNHGLLVADILHMPNNTCGVWPAFWMLGGAKNGEEWPLAGEIDILEGVNAYDSNAVTLHTSAGCVVDNATSAPNTQYAGAKQLGVLATSNCDVNAQGQGKNVGCSIHAPAPSVLPTYGAPFNAAGGGVYAMQRTPCSISVWFLPSNTTSSLDLTTSPDPSTWGLPLARFSGPGCDFDERFRDMKIIFNTAFCGEWAGAEEEWGRECRASTGYETCEEWVGGRPEAFVEAYWEIGGLRWFERGE
ncbi:hypothetical protein EJ04DRAFT_588071 [Polyplosphaeria fusca]|uniref:GH16 domain-containing protein n=1 Tax=Polyplosphaeria fusca TaxID=682080 RepID=A0A9P4R3Z2_9PLEO|nr:hypothetical protein EJ04DRAFT_588071 [Polyplosphaeria fusca]